MHKSFGLTRTLSMWLGALLCSISAAQAEAQFTDPVAATDAAIPMMVVPAGRFLIGSPAGEAGRSGQESPQKEIVFAQPFALGKTEVTVAQFREFVEASGYITVAEKAGASSVFHIKQGKFVEREGVNWRHGYRGLKAGDEDPVVHVAWADAMAFSNWLAQETGEAYRLPTEAEFEYALRAGTTTRYWWGDAAPHHAVENLAGARDRVRGSDLRWPAGFRNYTDRHWGLAPVGTFPPNPFGLQDMGGNAAEWVADCYSDTLADVPDDGRALLPDDCDRRVMRGASWANPPPMSRSAFRISRPVDKTSSLVGFRVARDLRGMLLGEAGN